MKSSDKEIPRVSSKSLLSTLQRALNKTLVFGMLATSLVIAGCAGGEDESLVDGDPSVGVPSPTPTPVVATPAPETPSPSPVTPVPAPPTPEPTTLPTPSPTTAPSPAPTTAPSPLPATPTPAPATPTPVIPTPEPTQTPGVMVNVALNKAVTQSSTDFGGSAERGVDGITDGAYRNGSVTHTTTEDQAWWQVDLSAAALISHINVFNRTDDCCTGRLSDFYVLVSETGFDSTDLAQSIAQPGVASYYYASPVDGSMTVDVGLMGRYVRVQLAGTSNVLSLAEVEVMSESDVGTPTPTPVATPTATPTEPPVASPSPTPTSPPAASPSPTPTTPPVASPTPEPTPPALTGEELYELYCQTCHGTLENSAKLNRSAEAIAIALDVIPQMQLIDLSAEEIDLVAQALSSQPTPTVTPTPVDLTGAELYELHCQNCHQNLENSTKLDRSASNIIVALDNIPFMQAIDLTVEQINLVADALSTRPDDTGGSELAEWQLTLLTAEEYVASLKVLFGESVLIPDFIPEVSNVGGTPLLSTGSASINQSGVVNNYYENGLAIAEWLMDDDQRAVDAGLCTSEPGSNPIDLPADQCNTTAQCQTIFGSSATDCANSATATSVCMCGNDRCDATINTSPVLACDASSLSDVAKRIWRKELTSEEEIKIQTLFDTASNNGLSDEAAYTHTLGYLLQAPCLIYRICDLPSIPDGDGNLALDDYQMATQLAFTLTGATPTDALLQIASEGRLSSDEDIEREARAIMQTDVFVNRMMRLFDDHFDFSDFSGSALLSPELRFAMEQELEKAVEHLLTSENDDLRTLFTTPYSFMNSTLAQHYGLAVGDLDENTFEQRLLPDGRQGLLSFASTLTRYGSETGSLILRGLFVSEKLLCNEIEIPGDIQSLIDSVEDIPRDPELPYYEAESKVRINQPDCSGCHVYMDTIGLGFEQFDEMGIFRTQDAQGRTHSSAGQFGSNRFTSMAEFSNKLVESEDFSSCFVENIYTRTMGRALLPNHAEEHLLEELNQTFIDADYSVSELILAILKSSAIRSVSESQQ